MLRRPKTPDDPPPGPAEPEPPFADHPSAAPKRATRAASNAERAARNKALEQQGLTQSASEARGEAPPKPFAGKAALSQGFARIVERVFDLPDPDAEYQALTDALHEGSNEFDSTAAALGRAEDNARRAHRLFVNAKVDFERYEVDADTIEGAMWDEAVSMLSQEKERGLRSKQVTDSDVRHRVGVLYPDEWRDSQTRRAEGKRAVEHLERLADLWQSRCRSLAALLGRR